MIPTVVLVGSLDTKGPEYAFAKACLEASEVTPVVVDFGVLGEPSFAPDFTADEVARAGGACLQELRFTREGSDTRAVALATMERGVSAILSRLRAEGRCDSVLGMAGSGGSTVISGAMRCLPIGVPKLLVSTMASGNVGGYVGTRDLIIAYPITDIAGLNGISRKILSNAAAAAAGMARGVPLATQVADRPLVAITMFGITTPGVLRIRAHLEKAGFDPVVFHATGSGIRRPTVFGWSLIETNPLFYVTLIVFIACYLILRRIVRSPFGLALQGIRDDPVRMGALGYNVQLHRLMALVISGALAGIAGVLGVFYYGGVSPATTGLSQIILVVMAAIAGGVSSMKGVSSERLSRFSSPAWPASTLSIIPPSSAWSLCY
jgi:branched-subunit amino acid ABC-type transport system permease component